MNNTNYKLVTLTNSGYKRITENFKIKLTKKREKFLKEYVVNLDNSIPITLDFIKTHLKNNV